VDLKEYFECYVTILRFATVHTQCLLNVIIKTLRTGDADLRFYITTVQDG